VVSNGENDEAPEGRNANLLVDDNDDFRYFMKDTLKKEFSLLEHPNGTRSMGKNS
jgi:response regulator RpfG family c-di-GMP phosphodiesterase